LALARPYMPLVFHIVFWKNNYDWTKQNRLTCYINYVKYFHNWKKKHKPLEIKL
jgi:hypothetical protein